VWKRAITYINFEFAAAHGAAAIHNNVVIK